MDRLTKTYSDGTHGAADNLPCGENSYGYKELLLEALGKYEDLEEQGRLLRLPCDIGTRVYKPFILVCPGKPWLFAPNIGVNYITLEDLPEVGEKIFLTRQEAEEKLDEIVKEYVTSLKMEESHDRK